VSFARKSKLLLALGGSLLVVSLVTGTAITPGKAAKAAPAEASISATDVEVLQRRRLAIPVKGVDAAQLRDNFEETRGKRKHEAIDILAPKGTHVIAAGDGRVAKLFTSAAGGLTVYQIDPDERFIYYYAHLDRYAEGLKEGVVLKKGDLVGYVGTSGNAPKNTPHLHFTIFRLGPTKQWWKGTALNPYPFLVNRG
jgi:peptidoglycan LD-endopeptidase LytH